MLYNTIFQNNKRQRLMNGKVHEKINCHKNALLNTDNCKQ